MAENRSASVFGNPIAKKDQAKARRAKERFVRKFGDDSKRPCHLTAADAPAIHRALGVRLLAPAPQGAGPLDLAADARAQPLPPATPRTDPAAHGAPVVVGTIRMGFGHYRIGMALASAAHAMGYTPYWMDLCGFPDTTCTKIIAHQNDLYSKGSRISQKYAPFNKLVWEPLNSEGFRKLAYNASDQAVSELMCAPFADLPQAAPFVGAHAWCAQAALHAGLSHVVCAIPDNWPMALHLAEGARHTVQTPSAYLGYKMLRGMDPSRALAPMPDGSLFYTGHYVDHELVAHIDDDCTLREERAARRAPVRYLLSVGGAGAQIDLFERIIAHLVPRIEAGEAVLFVNVGDHDRVWRSLVARIPALDAAVVHSGDFEATARFAEGALTASVEGVHAFYDSDIFSAVYSTNLLMRACDLLITKPSELSFYPVPKLMIQRVGGHEAWGAVRAAEVGDGTYEMDDPREICAFIDSVQEDPSIVARMCAHIRAARDAGIYDGAYRAIELAVR
ncbi:DUF6937 domain-containing protein [Hugonella massiliensis]|uniref:DUF6937 domain-containing protein n=1 Tax=Hugonella massiliensis TaxID=1720315 RepID=UPI00073F46E2|nr:hypothetical protein [Hugonella massiliensis]